MNLCDNMAKANEKWLETKIYFENNVEIDIQTEERMFKTTRI